MLHEALNRLFKVEQDVTTCINAVSDLPDALLDESVRAIENNDRVRRRFLDSDNAFRWKVIQAVAGMIRLQMYDIQDG